MSADPKHGPLSTDVAEFLAEDEDQYLALMEAFTAAAQPFDRGVPPQALSDAYTMAGYWLVVAQDRLRAATDGRPEDYGYALTAERYMKALINGLDRAIMVALSLARIDRVR